MTTAATRWPAQTRAAMNDFYGDPDADGNGVPDRKWEDANLVSLAPPYPMKIAWATTTPVKSIRIHRKAAPSLASILAQILNYYGTHEAIEAAGLHLYGGAYNFRLMRGAADLSIHSWGAAIDLDPARNAFKRKYDVTKGMMPTPVIEIFQAEGWVWGGRWRTPDAMHFQAATV